jgi:glycosyltransferase involved in cell wall biosynthesis
MSSTPIVSFIVASYNYEKFIGTAIQSIIDQTVSDIEILVIDDASTDRSRQVIEGFSDPRIQLYVNETNMGPSSTYNRAARLAKGEYIAYLDSDDCMDPIKTEQQLEYFNRNPTVDVVSTYLKCIDAMGNRHASLADTFEGWANQPHDFNVLDTWIVRCLVSVSVMHRRSLHDRVGFRDPTMTLADYELWTRAFKSGCRFGIVHAPLLWRRRHGANADYSNPMRAFLELSFAMMKNLMPMTESPLSRHSAAKMIGWVMGHDQLALMPEVERYRVLALLSNVQKVPEFSVFKAALADDPNDPTTTSLGKHLHTVYSNRPR